MRLPALAICLGLSNGILLYRWLEGVQFIEFMTFNVESEFLSLCVHRFKRVESQDDLVVANLALRQQPWMAIYCKAPPNSLDPKATREHAEDLQNVKESRQGKHGFESQEQGQWALLPPTDVDGFVRGTIWAIVRVGNRSDVRKVEKQRLDDLLFDEAHAKYSEITGPVAANQLSVAHQHQNRGMGVSKAQCIDATMDFTEKTGVFNTRYEKWFEKAANMLQDDRSKEVCRLKQTCTPKEVARKYLKISNYCH